MWLPVWFVEGHLLTYITSILNFFPRVLCWSYLCIVVEGWCASEGRLRDHLRVPLLHWVDIWAVYDAALCRASRWQWNTSPKTTPCGNSAIDDESRNLMIGTWMTFFGRFLFRSPVRTIAVQSGVVGAEVDFLLREGEAGRVYFYQNELPYDVDQAG